MKLNSNLFPAYDGDTIGSQPLKEDVAVKANYVPHCILGTNNSYDQNTIMPLITHEVVREICLEASYCRTHFARTRMCGGKED